MTSGDRRPLSYYEDLQARVRALLITTGSWISPEQLSLFSELVDSNECGIALDMLSEALASSNARVHSAIIHDMQSLSDQMGLKPEVLDRIRSLRDD